MFWDKEGGPTRLELGKNGMWDKFRKFVRSQITRAPVGLGESEFKMALDLG